jgi:quercetin dioxygenase-like cupin family protein
MYMGSEIEEIVVNDLEELAREHLVAARDNDHGRSSYLYLHDGPLRQMIIVLTAGAILGEHNAPTAASLFVLSGRVRLLAGDGVQELVAGRAVAIPQERHAVEAVEDSAFVLTTVT